MCRGKIHPEGSPGQIQQIQFHVDKGVAWTQEMMAGNYQIGLE
jgi:hypothetical protein